MSSIKTAVPKPGRFDGFTLSNDCMRAFTADVDMPVGVPSVTSRFVLEHGLVRQAQDGDVLLGRA